MEDRRFAALQPRQPLTIATIIFLASTIAQQAYPKRFHFIFSLVPRAVEIGPGSTLLTF